MKCKVPLLLIYLTFAIALSQQCQRYSRKLTLTGGIGLPCSVGTAVDRGVDLCWCLQHNIVKPVKNKLMLVGFGIFRE